MVCNSKILRVKNHARNSGGAVHPVHPGPAPNPNANGGSASGARFPKSVSGYSLQHRESVMNNNNSEDRPLAHSASNYSMSSGECKRVA